MLRRHGIKISSPASLKGKLRPYIVNQGDIQLGSSVAFGGLTIATELHCSERGQISIGSGTWINQGCTFAAVDRILIGENNLIGEHVAIHTFGFHAVSPDLEAKQGPVILGKNCWIGHRAIIFPGVSIGDHSVVAAGAVVTKSVPCKCVVAGIPARVISKFECPDNWKRN